MKDKAYEYSIDEKAFDPDDHDPMEGFLIGTAYGLGGLVVLLLGAAITFGIFTIFNR